MAFPDVDLVRLVARLAPDWRQRLRFSPLQLRWKQGWRRIRALRAEPGGLHLELAGGEAVKLSFERAEGTRAAQFRDLTEFILSDNPGFQLCKTDRVRHHSAAFLRLLLKRGRRLRVVVAARPDAPTSLRDRFLVSLLWWWDQLEPPPGRAEARAYVPLHWLEQLEPFVEFLTIPLMCHALPPITEYSFPISVPWHERGHSCLTSAHTILPSLNSLSPILQLLKTRYPTLDLQPRKGNWELSYRGFRLAWQEPDCGLSIYPGRLIKDEEQAHRAMEPLVRQVTAERSFPSRKCSAFYTSNPERWLESLVIGNLPSLVPDATGPVYAQVPTYIDGRRKVLDLLTVDRKNRLLVLELKVEKELGIVFQALDYWQRVCAHLAHGDLGSQGYFPNQTLQSSPPRVVLVAPLFEFHPVLPILRKYLSEQIRFECIGVSADWRRNFRVLSRFEF